MKTFPVIIEEDKNGYVISCPAFEGCYSQGKTIEEALDNIKEAIELCLEDNENNIGNIMIGSVVIEQ